MRAVVVVTLAMLHAAPSCGESRTPEPTPQAAAAETTAAPEPASMAPAVAEPPLAEPAPVVVAAPAPAPPALEQQIRDALPPAGARPGADPAPHRVGDGWLTPAGAPITHAFELEWSRPKEQEGWPTLVLYCESEGRYWLHEGFLQGGLSTHRVWLGPFLLEGDGSRGRSP